MDDGHHNILSVVFTNAAGDELEQYEAPSGQCAQKLALLMLAKRDALAPGDMLRVLAPNVTRRQVFAKN
jgi:hypothetical protein